MNMSFIPSKQAMIDMPVKFSPKGPLISLQNEVSAISELLTIAQLSFIDSYISRVKRMQLFYPPQLCWKIHYNVSEMSICSLFLTHCKIVGQNACKLSVQELWFKFRLLYVPVCFVQLNHTA